MPDESIITDEHRAVIGKPIEGGSVTVSEQDAERLRAVLNDADPRWAPGTGIAPPYILALLEPNAPMAQMPRVLPGGLLTNQEWQLGRPIRIGETFTCVSQVLDIRERMGGRYGHSVLITFGTDYVDAGGNKVASTMRTLTQFDPQGGKRE